MAQVTMEVTLRRTWKITVPMIFASALGLMLADAGSVAARNIAFTGWTHQKFSLFGGNRWDQSDTALSVVSDGSVSLVWRALPESAWQASTASWTWTVDQGVPQTDLAQKGGDDRNLSLYFIFAPQEVAASAKEIGIRGLLQNPDIRVLMYVWGGRNGRGDVLPSPYLGDRGKTIILRPSGTGQHDETVRLRADLNRVYGRGDLSLIGLAVSADSDDTRSRIRASISNLSVFGGA